MKQTISLFLTVSILILSGNSFARERKGTDLIIQRTDGTQIRGELIAVKADSLLLLERESGADMTIEIDAVKFITVVNKLNALDGFITGSILGLILGSCGPPTMPMCGPPSREEKEEWFLRGIITCALIGTGIGAAFGKNKTIQLEGQSDYETQEILKKLRKKARIKNAL